MAYEALKHYSDRALTFRFVSNVDGTDFAEATRDLDPAETLFIISSKTFTTLETMTNAQTARAWCLAPWATSRRSPSTSSPSRPTPTEVSKFGIDTANMFEFWDWVGGRYSMDSAIGLSTMIAIGPENFRAMLAGFHAMDEHFRTAPFERNLPVLLGLLTVWYTDFFGAETVAVLPYDQYLKRFPAYLQQLTMESNGKSVTLDGTRVLRDRPGLLGRAGDQRPALVLPADPPGDAADPLRPHRLRPVAQPAGRPSRPADVQRVRPGRGPGLRQDGRGRSRPRGRPTGWCRIAPSRATARRTSSWPKRLTPEILGALVALYEHSVFTQGTIWRINSFDQWGVELGKVLAKRIIPELESQDEPKLAHDSSTNALIRRYRKLKGTLSAKQKKPVGAFAPRSRARGDRRVERGHCEGRAEGRLASADPRPERLSISSGLTALPASQHVFPQAEAADRAQEEGDRAGLGNGSLGMPIRWS